MKDRKADEFGPRGKPPSLAEFMLHGVPLKIALDIVKRWDTASEKDLLSLGLVPKTVLVPMDEVPRGFSGCRKVH